MVKLSTYAAMSVACMMGMVYHVMRTRRQFYLVMFYLAHSRISLVLLLNMGFVMMCTTWQLVNAIFLGPLREAEVERLNEQFWREVMEILFAMTVFRDEFNLQFVVWITVLLFIKGYHWLTQKRVEYIETTPSVQLLSHVRLCTFMGLLLTLDCLFFHRSFSHLRKTRQASVSLFFAFEYAILVITTIATIIKYALHVREMTYEGRSPGRDVHIFYLELVHDLLHLTLYLLFFLVIFIYYGLPLHLVRELYETFRNFKTRIADFLRYRRLTSNMNERFPDPTPEEINRDATCIVCREEMTIGAKKLPCGHLFHAHCLRSWLERQQTCPTCRSPVLGSEDESDPNDHDDDNLEFDVHAYEVEDVYVGDENDSSEEEQTTDNMGGTSGTDSAQLHNAATTAGGQYGQSCVYPAYPNGGPIWYPVFVPVGPQPHGGEPGPTPHLVSRRGSQVGPKDDHSGYESDLGATPRGLSHAQNPPMQRWVYVPLKSLRFGTPNQPELQLKTMPQPPCPPSLLVSSAPYGTPLSTCPVEGDTTQNNGATPPTRPSWYPASSVYWIPGHLSVSRFEEQQAYLKHVSQILQGQLHLTNKLRHQLRAMNMKEEPFGIHESDGSEDTSVEQSPTQENDHELSDLEISNKDRKGKKLIGDHCEHCSLTQSTVCNSQSDTIQTLG